MNVENRKFQYGDGFFETIMVNNSEISYWDYHFQRIEFASKTLKLSYTSELKNDLEKAIISNAKYSTSRIKIQFWRASGGLYTPKSSKLKYSIECFENTIPKTQILNKVGICNTSKVTPSPFSSFKCFLLPYVIAGIEKEERSLDDLILLNDKDYICESISSNVFWRKENQLFTPSLTTGCISGIMRMQFVKDQNVIEGEFKISELENSDEIFLTNVTGIKTIKNIQF